MLVEVKDLSVEFGTVKAVRNVSFALERGETVGLVGESGSGKSTVARVIAGLQKPTAGACKVNCRVGMIFQDPLGSLNPRQTVRSMLSEVLRHGGGKGENSPEALLKLVGLEWEVLDKYPHEFSGGQRQRLSIAREIAAEPELLICDEAVSALDLSVRATILDLLKELKAKFSLTLLFITHDLGVVNYLADRVMVMQRGQIIEKGPSGKVLKAPREAYTKRLIASVLRLT